jgi:hypothetical protein
MLDAYRGLIDELLAAPSEIRNLLGSAGPAEQSPEIRRLVAEVRDRDRVVLALAQTMTRQNNPYLSAITVAQSDANQDLEPLLDEMEMARGDLVSLLINLSLKDWERGAIHETKGEVTLADEIEDHVEFDESQREQIRKLAS